MEQELTSAQKARPWAEKVSATARFRFTPGLWKGPLAVLVDADSASASELFAAMLQDSEAAAIVGAHTFGSGCGWTLPPEPSVLRHSGGRLLLPNCARFRRDGSNEVASVELRTYDTPRERAARLGAKLPAIVDAALRLRR